ncbi:MAG: hypothetical protein WAU68_15640 [Vitreimonas sp.]
MHPSTADQLSAFAPATTAEIWQAHLDRVLPSPDDQAFLARVFGYGMLGAPQGKVRVICVGSGPSGKTTTLQAIRRTLGSYAGMTERGALRVSRNDKSTVHFTEHNSLPFGRARARIGLRTLVLPFDAVITEAERDRARVIGLADQCGEAILNWVMEGVGDYIIRGDLAPPPNVARFTQSYLDALAAPRRARAA